MEYLTVLFVLVFLISLNTAQNSTSHEELHNYICATLVLEICESSSDARILCALRNTTLSWNNGKNSASDVFNNVLNITSVSTGSKCHLTLCDDDNRMGYCAQFPPGVQVTGDKFQDIFQSGKLRASCDCSDDEVTGSIPYSDEEFDRNYFGVIYSMFDRPIELQSSVIIRPTYSEKEIATALKQISKRFTYIAIYENATTSSIKEFNKDQFGLIPNLTAKINRDQNHLALRVAIEVLGSLDKINPEWTQEDISNAIEIAKNANKIFNGTVWGLIVTSNLVKDISGAQIALDMIRAVRRINEGNYQRLKIGIRLSCCDRFRTRVNDTIEHIKFRDQLVQIANFSDFIACAWPSEKTIEPLELPPDTDRVINGIVSLRNLLLQTNRKLKLIIETGYPSGEYVNDPLYLERFKKYWEAMAKLAKDEHIMFHMYEAFDQPLEGYLTSKYGWWERYNNSEPPVYLEKVSSATTQPSTTQSSTTQSSTTQPATTESSTTQSSTTQPSSTKIPVELNQGQNKNQKRDLFKIMAFCLAAFGAAAISIMVYLYKQLYAAKKQVIGQIYINQFHSGGNDENARTGDDGYTVALRLPYNSKYEMPRDTFQIEKSTVLGQGHFGVVHRGTFQKDTDIVSVAFKCTNSESTVHGIKAIMSEIKILSYLGSHENLVCLIGAYTKKIQRGIIYMALEFCPLGCVADFLRKADFKDTQTIGVENSETSGNNDINYVALDVVGNLSLKTSNQITILNLAMWSEQIASAMDYVSEMKVVHADLSAKNVLLKSINHAKVSDFGLSKKTYQDIGITHDKFTPLPWRWMAPESLRHLSFSSQSDVWSYGVTLWEIFSLGEVPYPGVSYNSEFLTRLIDGERLPIAKHAPRNIYEEIKKCWELDPSSRPTFKKLQQIFNDFINEYRNTSNL